MTTQDISPSSSTYKIHHQPITLCIIGSACSNKRILSSVEDRYVYEYINDERQVICTLVETKILLSQRQLRIYIVDSFDVIDFSDFVHYLGESVRKDYSDLVTYVISHANIGEKYLVKNFLFSYEDI
ncbi:unnamed protein product [Rotaria sordida]|uniref:Uncharacterized protein n=1 Tax=Rotaria sordida TaxID=392033 RepID=A0A815I772_9BILA|nr:unnamed protein product [Rotaria sordida]